MWKIKSNPVIESSRSASAGEFGGEYVGAGTRSKKKSVGDGTKGATCVRYRTALPKRTNATCQST